MTLYVRVIAMGSTDPIHEKERRYSSHVLDYRKLNKVTFRLDTHYRELMTYLIS